MIEANQTQDIIGCSGHTVILHYQEQNNWNINLKLPLPSPKNVQNLQTFHKNKIEVLYKQTSVCHPNNP